LDPLSDVLRAIRLDGAHFYRVDARAPWIVATEPATALKPRILPRSEHLVSYHVVVEGGCVGGLAGGEMVDLAAGDVIVFPHGGSHVMASDRDVRPNASDRLSESLPRFPFLATLGGSDGARVSLICGFLGCDRRPFNPLLSSLPNLIHVRAAHSEAIASFSRVAVAESESRRPGADLLLTRLAELMFVEVLRNWFDALPAGKAGWIGALRDPVAGPALAALHEEPARDWSLRELAARAAASRSVLAERFAERVGAPPMQYLAQWRLQLAANLLATTSLKVAAVGAQVGYRSEAAFSRTFHKATGSAPTAWRKRRSPR
jgi:AraC-like DNA-binding protein